jgi:putative flavoprotein involved in K+ transport
MRTTTPRNNDGTARDKTAGPGTSSGVEHFETVIVGAGQAGLATAHHLQQLGRECVVLDAEARVGDNWRNQWDSLRLFTPAWADGLPGLPFPGPRWSMPTKDQFADYLESYAAHSSLPVRLRTGVERLTSGGPSGYVLTTVDRATGRRTVIEADNVVVATGTFGRTPFVPDFADQLDPGIRQLHSSDYRRPSQLADGTVLVVGASHSGCDLAWEAAATHHTLLVGRDTGQIPVPFDSPMAKVILPMMLVAFRHVLTRRTPMGRRQMDHFRSHGGPRLRVQAADLQARGVEWVKGRVIGVRDGLPVIHDGSTVDGRAVEAGTVIWCTGFRQVFGWVDLPVFGVDGWPLELDGVAQDAPGLYFAGLCFQSAAASGMVHGAGRDAERVARHIARRTDRSRSHAKHAVAA